MRTARFETAWLALWCAVLGWDALSPHVLDPWSRLAVVTLVLAAILLATSRERDVDRFSPGLAVGMAVGCGVVGVALPWPEGFGFVLAGAGLLVSAIPVAPDAVRGAARRALVGRGALLVLLAAAGQLYRLTEAATQGVDLLSGPLAFLYRVVGVRAAADAPFVYFQGVGGLFTVTATFERVVGHPLALFVVGGLALLLTAHGRRIGWRRPAVLLASASAFAILRALALGLVLGEAAGPSIYWLRGWTFGGLLVLAVFLAAAMPRVRAGPASSRASRSGPATWRAFAGGRGVALLASAIAFGALAAASLGVFDPGTPKAGRVLIDERHSNWAWSTIELNTESYGTQTVYNYSELLRYLGHFYETEPSFAALTDSLLATTDVVILKTPTQPYEDDEVDALVRFVERGGGLWLVGDHTNVFGTSTHLNKVARRFGLRYRYDAVTDLVTSGRQLYERPRLFPHPSIAHLPPMLLATSCSVAGPPLGRRVMLGRSLLVDELDYSVNAFFGNFAQDAHEPFGNVLQTVAVTRGRGRVLAFSDSTILSNFFLFIRGKRELALGSVAWLMRENQRAWLRPVLLAGALAALMLWMWLVSGTSRWVALASLAVGAAPAFSVAAVALSAWVAGWSALPEPAEPMREAAFMRERCAFHVPERRHLADNSPHSYYTFYIWTQRVDYVPRTDPLARCIEDADATVILNPRGEFTPEMLSDLEAYVRGGGGLLVLDRSYVAESTANAVLAPFGLAFEPTQFDSVLVFDVVSGDSFLIDRAGVVVGGEPVLEFRDGRSALALARVGEGVVVAMPAADSFSDEALGTTSRIPDERQLGLYRLEFRIFDELLRGEEDLRGDEHPPGDESQQSTEISFGDDLPQGPAP